MLFPCPPATLMRACMEEARGVLLHSSLLRRLLRRIAPRMPRLALRCRSSSLRSWKRPRGCGPRRDAGTPVASAWGPAALAWPWPCRAWSDLRRGARPRWPGRCHAVAVHFNDIQWRSTRPGCRRRPKLRLEAREKAPCPTVLYIAAPHANRQEFRSGTL